jgi:hypothetical protein
MEASNSSATSGDEGSSGERSGGTASTAAEPGSGGTSAAGSSGERDGGTGSIDAAGPSPVVADAATDAGSDGGEAGAQSEPCTDADGDGLPDTPAPGCVCELGTSPMFCDPPDRRVTQGGVMGTLVCSEGTMYCRDAVWSECELLLQYAMFVPD